MIGKNSFSPVTESDRDFSDTPDDEGVGKSNAADSSQYSPVSDVEPEQQEVKTEVEAELLRMAHRLSRCSHSISKSRS